MSVEIAIALVASGIAVGFASALFGVGGGILMVPLIVLVFGKSQHLAEGTSLLVIVPTALSGVIAQRRTGEVSFRHAALLAMGGVGGAYLGAAIALHLPHNTLQAIFGVALLLSGLRVIKTGLSLRIRRAPALETVSPALDPPVSPVHVEPTALE